MEDNIETFSTKYHFYTWSRMHNNPTKLYDKSDTTITKVGHDFSMLLTHDNEEQIGGTILKYEEHFKDTLNIFPWEPQANFIEQ